MPNLNRRLQIFEYVDASPDENVDSPTYTYARTVWGRIDPLGMGKDTLIAGAARQESDVAILFRDSTPVGAGAVVVDPLTGEQWRIAGSNRLRSLRLIRYIARLTPRLVTSAPSGVAL